jgi:hypothetical protein
MNPHDHNAEKVWVHTLPRIRTTRRKRKTRKIAAATAACFGLAIWLTLQNTKPDYKPVVHIEPITPKIETMAVMRIDNSGTIRLEEIALNELGDVEFTFGQHLYSPTIGSMSEIETQLRILAS